MKKYEITGDSKRLMFGVKNIEAENKKEAKAKLMKILYSDINGYSDEIRTSRKSIKEGKRLLRKGFVLDLFMATRRAQRKLVKSIILTKSAEIFFTKRSIKCLKRVLKGRVPIKIKEIKPKTLVKKATKKEVKKALKKIKGKK